jgi:hypothetical protein
LVAALLAPISANAETDAQLEAAKAELYALVADARAAALAWASLLAPSGA